MILFDKFKVIFKKNNFEIQELLNKEIYTSDKPPKKTGKYHDIWEDIQSYHPNLRSALKEVAVLAIQRGFNDIDKIEDLITRINEVKSICEQYVIKSSDKVQVNNE